MRRGIVSVVFGLALMSGANAADAIYQPPVFEGGYSPGQGHDWSGAYIGASVAYAWGESTNDWRSPPDFPDWAEDGVIAYSGGMIGLQVGYQQQFGSLVVGAEADLGATRLIGDDSQFAGRINQIEIDALGTVRARVGWAQDRVLFFGTAGLAAASFEKSDVDGEPATPQLATGWTVGAGVDLALDDNWSLRAEYNYIQLGAVDTAIDLDGGVYMHRANDPYANVVRLGVNYSF